MAYTKQNFINILAAFRNAVTECQTLEVSRCLGVMEAILVQHDKLAPGVDFDFQLLETKFIKGNWYRKEREEKIYETHRQFIIRNFEDFIKEDYK